MKITREEVRHVAALARLRFSPQEEEILTGQLDKILQYMEKLNQLDTKSIEITSHAISIINLMRDDQVRPSFPSDEMLANAPDREGPFLRVPKIIEK